jgi:hypothetical protein
MIILDQILPTRKAKQAASAAAKLGIDITGSKYWYDVLIEIDKLKS